MPMTVLAGYWVRGVNVTVVPFTLYVPATYSVLVQAAPSKQTSTSTLCVFTDAASIRLLIVNVTGLVTDTPVALFAGVVEESVNELAPYELVPAVNLLVKGVTELPSMSAKPPTEIVYTLEAVSDALGEKVSVTPSLARVTVPAIALPPAGVTVIELLVIDVGSIVLLITATISTFNGTPVWALEGIIVLTVTWLVSAVVPVTKVEPDKQ